MDPLRTILSLQPGDVLVGRYKLIARLGRGAMGEVWKAEDHETGKVYALKMLPAEFIGSDAADKRMKAEAAIGEGLSHDSIVRLFGYERDPARANISFLRMEFVEGRTLADILDTDGPQPLDRVLRWARDLAEGIDYAHGKKVLHRDIKPGNVMIETATGKARLLDFGIGREIRNTMSVVSQKSDSSGTPAYMSPQQVMGDNHPSNDIYSLAATLYHALSGKPPFTDGHIQTQILHKPAPPIPGLPAHVNAALLKGLAKEIGERPATAKALAELLATAPKPLPPPVTLPNEPVVNATRADASITRRQLGSKAKWYAAVLATFGILIAFVMFVESEYRYTKAMNEAIPRMMLAYKPYETGVHDSKTFHISDGVSLTFKYVPFVAPTSIDALTRAAINLPPGSKVYSLDNLVNTARFVNTGVDPLQLNLLPIRRPTLYTDTGKKWVWKTSRSGELRDELPWQRYNRSPLGEPTSKFGSDKYGFPNNIITKYNQESLDLPFMYYDPQTDDGAFYYPWVAFRGRPTQEATEAGFWVSEAISVDDYDAIVRYANAGRTEVSKDFVSWGNTTSGDMSLLIYGLNAIGVPVRLPRVGREAVSLLKHRSFDGRWNFILVLDTSSGGVHNIKSQLDDARTALRDVRKVRSR